MWFAIPAACETFSYARRYPLEEEGGGGDKTGILPSLPGSPNTMYDFENFIFFIID